MPELKVKILNIDPGKKLSLQKHSKRSEFFFMPNGEVRVNLPGVWHAPQAPEDRPLSILEVQVGEAVENDKESISETSPEYDELIKKKIDINY
jgi:mannose-6-phosphate isomerase-like protein (cupin superfamily)